MGNDTFVSRRLNLLATIFSFYYFVHKIAGAVRDSKQVNNTFSNYELFHQ